MHHTYSHLQPAIFHLLELTPKGYVLSYGQIGKIFNISARQVGQILHQNKNPKIPCFKIVKADKTLATGYKFGGPQKQARRLKQEGIQIFTKGNKTGTGQVTKPKYKINARFWQIPQLLQEYLKLYAFFGPTNLWPWDPNTPQTNSPEEIIIGAILTQNTNWKNVEKAIQNLKIFLNRNSDQPTQNALDVNYLTLDSILTLPLQKLEELIRPAGYFRQKANYLKNVAREFKKSTLLQENLNTAWKHFNAQNIHTASSLTNQRQSVRKKLLSVKGVGPETADDILTYALLIPSFVVDIYLKRFINSKKVYFKKSPHSQNNTTNPKTIETLTRNYHKLQETIELELKEIPRSQELYVYQQFHALVVLWGKQMARKSKE